MPETASAFKLRQKHIQEELQLSLSLNEGSFPKAVLLPELVTENTP